ncbi:FAD-dependent oxidoreductase [Limimaricola sp. G21655-S1]|uniref:hydroxysqualene dehydroxylase n=1 Tax=Limimaricola sp. G21655-S1 TaxID=3014768 RepID=UPI0022AF213A|nr:FAD-dependent oxidoreductase [Limimaricola sp. G21655-S1]
MPRHERRDAVRRVHVVGAGLAGLAAALHLSERPGTEVVLHEATARAGGRCWSFHDGALDRVIDNGNHLVLSGNAEVLDHCRRIGTSGLLDIAPRAELPFLDLETGARWSLRLPASLGELLRGGLRLPPGTALSLGPDAARLMRAGPDATVAQAIPGRGPAWTRIWEPLSLAVLNAPPDHAAAAPLAEVLRRTVLRGGAASRPVTMPRGLGPTLVDPALARLAERGIRPNFRRPLTGLALKGDRLHALRFGAEEITLGPGDAAILALPPDALARLLDGPAPGPGQSILNAHFRVPPETAGRLPPILGLISSLSHWLFRRDDVISVTVSAAESCAGPRPDRDATLDRIWREVARAAGTDAPPLAARLIRARAATADASPAGRRARPAIRPLAKLALAGDWLAGPLPETIEAALLSGRAAAEALDG